MTAGLGFGSALIGVSQVRNVQRARKTGVIADSIKAIGPGAYDRRKNPRLYKLTLGGSVLAAVVCLCCALGFIGFAVYVLATW